MARPLRISYPNAFYHVTCRGNDRRAIFRDDHDRTHFLAQLESALEIFSVRLHAYVLMSNHFHLIVETPKANLSEFMRQFNISYTGYYNRRHGRIGHLYQGRFKAIVVDKDSYLLELSRYVHLNPIRIKAKRQRSEAERIGEVSRYRWSSLSGYLDGKKKGFVDDLRRSARLRGRIAPEICGICGGGDTPRFRHSVGRSPGADGLRKRGFCGKAEKNEDQGQP
jgi:REP element-mobilizing transposase RayT